MTRRTAPFRIAAVMDMRVWLARGVVEEASVLCIPIPLSMTTRQFLLVVCALICAALTTIAVM